jgi:hypothetical protein
MKDQELLSGAFSLLSVPEKGLTQFSPSFELELQGMLWLPQRQYVLLHFCLLVPPLFLLVGTRM